MFVNKQPHGRWRTNEGDVLPFAGFQLDWVAEYPPVLAHTERPPKLVGCSTLLLKYETPATSQVVPENIGVIGLFGSWPDPALYGERVSQVVHCGATIYVIASSIQ